MSDTFYTVDSDRIKDIADAIRLKRDITDEMTLEDMPMQIGLIEGGGSDIDGTIIIKTATIEKTVESADILVPFQIPNFNPEKIITLFVIRKGFEEESYPSAQWVGIGYSRTFTQDVFLPIRPLSVSVYNNAGKINYYNSGVSCTQVDGGILLTNTRNAILRTGEYSCAIVYSDYDFPYIK